MSEAADGIEAIAALWAARVGSPDATEADRDGLARWLAQHPDHQAAYAGMAALWSDLRHLPQARVRQPRRAATAALGVLLLLVLWLAGAQGPRLADRLRSDHATGVGEVRAVTLADGSRLVLDTDSAVRVRLDGTTRTVVLLRGRIFLDVALDGSRPFTARDDRLTVTVVGTRFTLAEGADASTVEVEEGRVAVAGGGGQAFLNAGEAARAGDGTGLALMPADMTRAAAWRSGRLVVANATVRDVLDQLGAYRPGRIVLLDASAGERRISGVFDTADTDQALRLIAGQVPVTVTQVTTWLVLVR